MAIDLSGYVFADFGASKGGSLAWASKKFGGRGLGIDLDPNKIASLRSKGYDGVEADITQLDVADNSVKYVIMMDFLEHLPSLDLAKKAVATAVRIASEFVYIVGPDFDHKEYLEQYGVMKYYADWSGHLLHHTPKEFMSVLADYKMYDTRLVQFERMYDTWDQALLPIGSPRNHGTYNPDTDKPKKYVDFDRKIYRRIMAVINKGNDIPIEQIVLRGLGVQIHDRSVNKPFFPTEVAPKSPAANEAATTKAAAVAKPRAAAKLAATKETPAPKKRASKK